MLRLLLGLVMFGGLMMVGLFILRALGRPVPPPLPPGEMRKVNLRFRCEICGTEVKMTSAPDELPEAPKHCTEEMVLVAPPIE